MGNGGATYSDVTGKNAWADFTPRFVTATLDAMAAQASMMSALGLAEQAAVVSAQAKDLTRDTPPGMVDSIMTARLKAAQALSVATKAGGDPRSALHWYSALMNAGKTQEAEKVKQMIDRKVLRDVYLLPEDKAALEKL